MTDMLTIGSSALYDSDYSYYEYGYKSSYRSCVGADYGHTTHKYAQTCYNTITTEYTSGCGYSIKSSLENQLCSEGTWSYPGYGSYHTVNQDHSHRYYAQYCVNTTGNFNVLAAYGHRVLAVGGVSASISTSGSGGVGISFNIELKNIFLNHFSSSLTNINNSAWSDDNAKSVKGGRDIDGYFCLSCFPFQYAHEPNFL